MAKFAEFPFHPLRRIWVRGQGQSVVLALLEAIACSLLRSPYLAVHPFQERLALLAEFLVVANQLQFLRLGVLRSHPR